jgi:endonuclease/exonuclease/phosphatase family metal-dependent hydrolase
MRLRVVSYNIHRAIGVDRRFRPDRVVRILSAYDADIVLLQEVDEGVPRSRELNLGRELA